MSELNPAKKKALLPKVKRAKLPVDFNSIEDLDTLKEFLALVTE